jgi:hypothetical protein
VAAFELVAVSVGLQPRESADGWQFVQNLHHAARGDFAFFAGIVLAYQLYETVEFAQFFDVPSKPVTLRPLGTFEISGATIFYWS